MVALPAAVRCTRPTPPQRLARHRWECADGHEPVLLARYDESGVIELRFRERVYVVHGRVEAYCPRCGARHVLDFDHMEAIA